MMKHEYREWGIAPDIEIVTFTSLAASLINDDILQVKNIGVPATYQDSFALVRDLDEVEEPRVIMNACTELHEMLLNRKELIWGVSKDRWTNAEHVGAKLLVVASPSEFSALSAVKPEDMEIMSVPELILACIE